MRNRREATFLEHLEELRQRLIRCIVYVIVGTGLSWFARKTLMQLALAPMHQAAEMSGLGGKLEFKVFEVAGGLILSMHIALVAGIILSAPLWLLEFWLFVEPALEDRERKWVVPLLPAAVLLFIGGVAFCYWLSPRAFAVLLRFQEDLGAAPEFMLQSYLTFFLRLTLIFGVMFELPLVIMFLAAVGLVKSAWLLKQWRYAIILIALVAAIVTPTPDAMTMAFLAGPMIGLYFLSILLARVVEKDREPAKAAESEEAPEPEPTVPAEPAADPYGDPEEEDHSFPAALPEEASAESGAGEDEDASAAATQEEAETPPSAFPEASAELPAEPADASPPEEATSPRPPAEP